MLCPHLETLTIWSAKEVHSFNLRPLHSRYIRLIFSGIDLVNSGIEGGDGKMLSTDAGKDKGANDEPGVSGATLAVSCGAKLRLLETNSISWDAATLSFVLEKCQDMRILRIKDKVFNHGTILCEEGFRAIIQSKVALALNELSLNCYYVASFSQETLAGLISLITQGNLQILKLPGFLSSNVVPLFTAADNSIPESHIPSTQLKTLDLGLTQLREEDFVAIVKSKIASSLVELHLDCLIMIFHPFSQEALDSLSALINKRNLKVLSLGAIPVDALEYLFSKGDNSIEEFSFIAYHFNDDQLVRLLSYLPVLKKLDISDNQKVSHDFPEKWFQSGGADTEMVGKRRKDKPLKVICNYSKLCANYLNRKWGRWWSFEQKRCRHQEFCDS